MALKRIKHKKMYITLAVVLLLALVAGIILQHPAFGKTPRGARLERIRQSQNWQEGEFANREETHALTSDEPIWLFAIKSLFAAKPADLTPKMPVEAVKTDLSKLDKTKDQVVWFGHSSYLLTVGGKTILVDPVLTNEFPASLFLSPFKGTDLYTPADIPAVDYLVITHDHWDHLDYGTMKLIRDRVGKVVCALGVGEHLEHWGFPADKIIEMDWDDSWQAEDGLKFTCLTARHFSGRLLARNRSLWASFLVEGAKTIFIGGDSGYGKHFAEIGQRFPNIDLVLFEAGQYNKDWAQIHTMPEEMPAVLHDLGAKQAIPVHNSKFALARHAWDEPVRLLKEVARQDSTLRIQFPVLGQPVTIE